ncbi:MAG: hypothetical protein DRI57_27380, partial [Deltaproteobacteria bacterium]
MISISRRILSCLIFSNTLFAGIRKPFSVLSASTLIFSPLFLSGILIQNDPYESGINLAQNRQKRNQVLWRTRFRGEAVGGDFRINSSGLWQCGTN